MCGGDTEFWSPPIRTGYGWKDYLEYDLLAIARLKKIEIGRPSAPDNRDITRIRILTSLTPGYFEVHTKDSIISLYD